jgi:hypothetical protein
VSGSCRDVRFLPPDVGKQSADRQGPFRGTWREWGRFVAKWVESKMVGGVSEVTLLTPIKKGLVPGEGWTYEQRLHAELNSIQKRVIEGYPTPIHRVPTIHFARWLILRPQQYLYCDVKDGRLPGGEPIRLEDLTSWLLFTSNFDGDMKAYLRDFAVFLGDDVDRIWGHCEGYPPLGSQGDFDGYWAYAKKYQVTTQAFYNAYPGLSVPRIHQLQVFKELFDDFVARTRRPDGRSIEGLADAFDQFVVETASFCSRFPDSGGIYQIPIFRSA